MFKNVNEDLTVRTGDSQVQTTLTDQRSAGILITAIPSALVGGQLFLKDGCSLLQKVNLEKRPCMRGADVA